MPCSADTACKGGIPSLKKSTRRSACACVSSLLTAALVERLVPKRGERVRFTVLRDGDPQDKVVALYP